MYLLRYNTLMEYLIKETKRFSKWISNLKDLRGKVTVIRRINRLKNGNFGDCKAIAKNINELRITIGPGYRIYFTQKEQKIIILLIGGDKSTQSNDIKKAKEILKELDNEN